MSKEQIVADAVSAIKAAQDQVLVDEIGKACDAAALEQKASDGTLSQADLDAAVQAAVAPLQQQLADLQAKDDADVAALAQAHVDADAAIADLKGQLDAAVAAKQAEDAVVQGLQAKADEIQKLVDALKGLVLPAPSEG